MEDPENNKKVLILIFGFVGIVIFFFVLMTRLDVMAKQTEASIQKLSADLRWEGLLYSRAILSAIENIDSSNKDIVSDDVAANVIDEIVPPREVEGQQE